MVSDGRRSWVVHRERVVFSPCDLAPWVSSLLMVWKGYVDCDRGRVWTYLLVGETNVFLQFTLDTVTSNYLHHLSSEFQIFQTETEGKLQNYRHGIWCQWDRCQVTWQCGVISRDNLTHCHTVTLCQATLVGCTLTQEFSGDEVGQERWFECNLWSSSLNFGKKNKLLSADHKDMIEMWDFWHEKQFRAVKLIFISRVAELIFFNSLCILCGISAFWQGNHLDEVRMSNLIASVTVWGPSLMLQQLSHFANWKFINSHHITPFPSHDLIF